MGVSWGVEECRNSIDKRGIGAQSGRMNECRGGREDESNTRDVIRWNFNGRNAFLLVGPHLVGGGEWALHQIAAVFGTTCSWSEHQTCFGMGR